MPGGIASHGGIPASRNAAVPYTWQHDRVPIRCLIVDDSDAFLEAASVLLQREGVTVAGVASNSAEALRQARALRPDVILVDIGLGDESGFDLARLLAQDGQGGSAEVILISTRDGTDYAELIDESPAAGFLVKSELSARAIGRILGHTP
jgi:DNA-binding NarL/FixJ family response regulator